MSALSFIRLMFVLSLFSAHTKAMADGRKDVDFAEHPWGKYVGMTDKCAAVAIGGAYVATSAHCGEPSYFCLQNTYAGRCGDDYESGYFKALNIVYGNPGNKQTPIQNDWLIFKVDRDIYGGFPVNLSRIATGIQVVIVGYPQVHNNGAHPVYQKCKVTSVVNGTRYFEANCDGSPGNSGGPVLVCDGDDCELIGIVGRAEKGNVQAFMLNSIASGLTTMSKHGLLVSNTKLGATEYYATQSNDSGGYNSYSENSYNYANDSYGSNYESKYNNSYSNSYNNNNDKWYDRLPREQADVMRQGESLIDRVDRLNLGGR